MDNKEAQAVIDALNLEKHVEGGYFLETFRSSKTASISKDTNRCFMTSIYYMLTKERPISFLVSNKSDLVMYYHLGAPLKVLFIMPDGVIEEHIVGPDVLSGHKLQVVAPSNCWKCYELMNGEFSLIGEAVGPGFQYEDMTLMKADQLLNQFPQHFETMKEYLFNE